MRSASEGSVTVRATTRVRAGEVIRLYREAGWWRPGYTADPSYIRALVRGSFVFVGAFHRGRLVGMGRCLSDGVSDAYIQDVTVLPRFRGRGIGARIVAAILERLRAAGMEWVGLVAETGSGRFYRRLGFSSFKGWTPMSWSGGG
ncbi:MAG: GNAT family N-acetyltransferase [Candidatus Aureabacteria bacterium]|nr:GNAT family N-acetyltransferase [Candidatus Auribacterota bacterium]